MESPLSDPQKQAVDAAMEILSKSGARACVAIGHGLTGQVGQVSMFSGVLVRIRGEIALATAAHCIEAERSYLAAGLESASVRIQWKDGDPMLIPNFVTDERHTIVNVLNRKAGYDFAVIRLPDVLMARIEASPSLMPVGLDECREPLLRRGVFFGLSGFPKCTNKVTATGIHAQMTTIFLGEAKRIPENADPDGVNIDTDPRFLATLAKNIKNDLPLKGASGGLMHAVDVVNLIHGERDEAIPRPVALQAKWWKGRIAAGNYLAEVIEAAESAM